MDFDRGIDVLRCGCHLADNKINNKIFVSTRKGDTGSGVKTIKSHSCGIWSYKLSRYYLCNFMCAKPNLLRTLTSRQQLNFNIISLSGRSVSQFLSHSIRITMSAWCLACVVLTYLYSGCLVSFVTIPKLRPIVENLDELANSNQLEVATMKSHFFESYLLVLCILVFFSTNLN